MTVQETRKNFCQWIWGWDPSCPSEATISPEDEGIVISRITPTAQPWKARIWGWWWAMRQWAEEVHLDPINTSGKDTSQGHSEWWTWPALILAWHGCLANEGRKKQPSGPKIKPSAVLVLSPASTKQIPQIFKASIFKLSLFYLYLGPKYWTEPHSLWWNLL